MTKETKALVTFIGRNPPEDSSFASSVIEIGIYNHRYGIICDVALEQIR